AVLFIVPFMFVYQPALLMIGPWSQILLAAGTSALGVICLAAGLQGWLRSRATLVDRVLLVVAGFLFVAPWLVADIAGLTLLAFVYGRQRLRPAPVIAHAPAASLD
ncbi:MAG: TRAP transporter permease, partial [Candidatus Rokuibacteriota bacterium]